MTATCFAPAPAQVCETYRHPETRKVRALRYYTRSTVRRGRPVAEHRVAIDFPALERPTELHRFPTVEQARECWREQRRAMACAGYERVER